MKKNVRVLIVEDEFVTLDTLRNYLEDSGYEVSGDAMRAEEALCFLEKSETDIAILDIQLKGGKDGILFANPDNFGELYGVVERTKMTVRMSYDEGATWPVKRLIHAGPSSYSTLVQLANGDIGILFEGGEKHRREWIRFARFSMAWLTGEMLP